LLARVAHEVRNPLAPLDIHIQLLEEDVAQADPALKERMTPRFETIRGELHRLETVVKQFVGLAGPQHLDLQSVSLPQIVTHVCELLRPEAAQRRIQLSARLSEGLPPILADGVQLTQALVNLVINAIQAIESDGQVEVSVHSASPHDTLVLQVRDTGPGIPAGKIRLIFEPFYTTKPTGSGLGLWIVQQIVTAHGGVVTASNPASTGANFTIHLPLRSKDTHG
jgi:two-component system sensor histidine kinase HydH